MFCTLLMEEHVLCFFAFGLSIEGTTEKVLQFIMQHKLIYDKNHVFIIQKCIIEHYREVQTWKNHLIDIFVM